MKYKDKKTNILSVNCGSSSLKYKIVSMPEEKIIVAGEAERIGLKTQESAVINYAVLGKKRAIRMGLPDHSYTFRKVMELIGEDAKKNREISFDVFAHRYVHPGSYFSKTARVTKNVLNKLKDTLVLAPIHNPTSYKLIELCYKEFPRVPQLVVFDNSFHAGIPKESSTYALPYKFARKYGLNKVGFHGISYEYAMQEACRFLNVDPAAQRIIACHLSAGGSSVCAIENGRSINNSMGFTPLEGLIMNTRSGDLDLGMVFYLMAKENLSADEIDVILNKKSGLLSIFRSSSDLRDIIKNMGSDPLAKRAFNMYIRKVKKYAGFYSLLLKKADILIFTDNVGTGLPVVREKICEGLGVFGVCLNKHKNLSYSCGVADVSADNSQVRIIVVPIEEELMIARAAYKELKNDTCS